MHTCIVCNTEKQATSERKCVDGMFRVCCECLRDLPKRYPTLTLAQLKETAQYLHKEHRQQDAYYDDMARRLKR